MLPRRDSAHNCPLVAQVDADGKPVLVKSNAEQIAKWRKPCWVAAGVVFFMVSPTALFSQRLPTWSVA